MKFQFAHYNFNILDLNRSIDFYEKNLGLKEVNRKKAADGSFELVFLGDSKTDFLLELTWLRDRKDAYNLGDNEIHLAMKVGDDYEEAHKFHKEQKVICYENINMGIYFIEDPNGYWIEIVR